MLTKIGHKFSDGRVAHIAYLEPAGVMHAYTEDEDGVIRDSLLIVCGNGGIRADVYSSVEPQSIIRPYDDEVVRDLLDTAQHVTRVLRGAERQFPMDDADIGAFHLVVTQLVEAPADYIGSTGN